VSALRAEETEHLIKPARTPQQNQDNQNPSQPEVAFPIVGGGGALGSDAGNMTSERQRSSLGSRVLRHADWIVLATCLAITAAATLSVVSSVNKAAEHAFVSRCAEIQRISAERLDDHARILLGGVALFIASGEVTREEWRIFTETQQVQKQLPGIQGIGFALLIPRADLPRHIQGIRDEGFPGYLVKPEGDREWYSSIIYLEPFSKPLVAAAEYSLDEAGVLTVHNPAEIEGFYRYPDLTRQCEFLAQMLEKTIRQAVPQEIHFLQKFDRARAAIAEIVDLPDRKREHFLMRLHKNGEILARKRREGEFSELTEREMADIESAYRDAFSD
jgi:hypothetical protein